jgi:thiol-disulfide isomerase/thioredoxin
MLNLPKMTGHYPISRRGLVAALASIPAMECVALALDHSEPAPNFRAKTLDGETISNDSVRGKAVLFQFWATWCPYCKRDMPALELIGQEFASQGLIVFGVDVGESKKKVKQFLDESPRSSKVILMEDTNLAAIFEARRFPLYVLIDPKGNVAGRQEGAGGESALRHLLRKAALASGNDSDGRTELQSSPRRD